MPFHKHELAYLDVRLRTFGHKNTVLIKGNQNDVPAIPIEGHVKLSTNEDLHVKSVRLSLVAEYQVDFYERSALGHLVGQVCEKDCALQVVWSNLLTSSEGSVRHGNYGDRLVKMSKLDKHHKGSREHSASNSTSSSLNNSSVDLRSMGGHLNPVELLRLRPGFGRALSLLNVSLELSLFAIPKAGKDGTPFPMEKHTHSHSFLLPQGNYSLPFRVVLPSNVPESVEGLANGKVLYKLECVVERGRFERSFTKAKHIRLVRTLHPQNMNLTDLIEFGNTWPGKLEFNVSTPRKALALGTLVPIKVLVVPLVKGLLFKNISAELVQHHLFNCIAARSQDFETVIAHQRLSRLETTCNDDHWLVRGHYKLPSLLKEVNQSCALNDDMVVVRHRLRVTIHIKNADGHVLEMRANLPVVVFMSPFHGTITTRHLTVDGDGKFLTSADPDREDVIFQGPDGGSDDENEDDDDIDDDEEGYCADRDDTNAPPQYNEHEKDYLYDQFNPQTPAEQLRSHGVNTIDSYFDFLHGASLPLHGIGSGSATPLDLTILLRVPSYERAVDDDSDDYEEEPAPIYPSSADSSALMSPGLFMSEVNARLADRSASMTSLLMPKDKHFKNRLAFLRREVDRTTSR